MMALPAFRFALFAVCFLLTLPAMAGTPYLVRDIAAGSTGSLTGISNFTNVNGILFFIADDGTNGPELWKSDGSTAGTVLVKDINPGLPASFPFVPPCPDCTRIQLPVAIGNALFFRADDGTNGVELWKSDGTAAGTVMVKDINPGGGSSNPGMLTNVNGTLYFIAEDGTSGIELWKSDGTTAGTVMVKDINPGSGSSSAIFSSLVSVNGVLFLTADDGTNGIELWKSDGTA